MIIDLAMDLENEVSAAKLTGADETPKKLTSKETFYLQNNKFQRLLPF